MIDWTRWRAVGDFPAIAPRVFAEIFDGGQSFRWTRISDSPPAYEGVWGTNIAQLKLGEKHRLLWRAPLAIERQVADALPRYLACGTDFDSLADAFSPRGNRTLMRARENFPGLRILRQPFGETLLGFICSATKQIPQIKQMLALLAGRHGAEILPGHPGPRALPSWPGLAALGEDALRACKLGFRARHVSRAARMIAARAPDWLDETEALPYAEARARLVALPGVGEKVADCTLLFGAGRLEAFPVDTWMRRAMCENYPRAAKLKPAQLADFARARFGGAAGLAQQYLFAHARAMSRRDGGAAPGLLLPLARRVEV